MTRREFLEETAGAAAGIAFVSCALTGAPSAQAQARRREVVVSGRRVKTVDVHAHCAVPEAMALMGRKVSRETLLMSKASDRIRAMDEQGIDVEALSINPYWYKADREVARQLIRVQNEKLAEACAANPDRFVAFASVALQYPDLAAEQLEEGVKKYGLRGAGVGGSVAGEELADPKFHPFWAKAEQSARLHARGAASPGRRDRGGPDRHGHRLSVPVDPDLGGPHPGHAGPDRRRARGDAGRDRGHAPRDQDVIHR
jgi:hypothetical protein